MRFLCRGMFRDTRDMRYQIQACEEKLENIVHIARERL